MAERCASLSLILLVVWLHHRVLLALLLYPHSSVFQLTSSIAVPLLDLPPAQHLAYDWGFQMNYDFPARLDSFYNAPIWPTRRRLQPRGALWNATAMPATGRHRRDLWAGELYTAFGALLANRGYHEECLQRLVCELARQPFALEPGNLLIAALNLLLTPSLHRGFHTAEVIAREAYEQAEWRGRSQDGACQRSYSRCNVDLWALVTRVGPG